MSSQRTIAILVILLLAGAVAYYIIKNRAPFEARKPAVDENAPEISLADLSGKMIRLSDFKGKIVLINFWASWCPPCVDEMPVFQKVYMEYENKGFAVIGIALDKISPELVVKMGILYPIVITNDRVTKDYGDISHIPVSFLVDKDGRIIRKVRGVYPGKDLRKDLEYYLKKG